MQGTINAGGRIATIKVRLKVRSLPSKASVKVTDVQVQPGGGVTGWQPHVTELPWSAGITA